MLGKEIIHELKWDGKTQERERNLMNADRVRTRPRDNAIFLTSNQEPILLETQRWFENKQFSKLVEKKFTSSIYKRDLPVFQRVNLTEI